MKIYLKYLFFINIIMIIFHITICDKSYAKENTKNTYFNSLQEKLIKDGFAKTQIEKLFNNPKVYFNKKITSILLRQNESKLNYKQFLKQKPIQNARKYKKKYQAKLQQIEKEYQVNQNIIVAIMLVETRLGNTTGEHLVFNTFSSIACLSDPSVKKKIWNLHKNIPKLTRKRYNKRTQKKSKWAYNELKALLKYTNNEKTDPLNIFGSYSGAIGIAQFLPSSILAYGKDGNNDGTINLFNHQDAINSIANYLKTFGWQDNITKQKQYNVIYRYNHSKYYVKTVLNIYELLKGK